VIEDHTLSNWLQPALTCAVRGDRMGARARYAELWAEATRAADRYRACVVAHFLAHTYTEPAAQLQWHRRALRAAQATGDERVGPFYPSLHANLAEVYLRLDNLAAARQHLDQAREAAQGLPEAGDRSGVQWLIDRLTQDIERSNATG